MEPLSPEIRKAILDAKNAAPEEINEYEQLLAERFRIPPKDEPHDGGLGAAPAPDPFHSQRQEVEQRLSELHVKLFQGLQGP
jgi:hypothetical protein